MTTEDEYIPTYLKAADVKDLQDRDFKFLLAEFPFYLYEPMLINFL